MHKITSKTTASLEFQLTWHDDQVTHTDCYLGQKVNFWRDYLPPLLQEDLMGKMPGDQVEIPLSTEEIIPPYQSQQIFTVDNKQFNSHFIPGKLLQPRLGRFYPRGILPDVRGTFKDTITPCRCIGQTETALTVDFNHPLAQRKITHLAAKVHDIQAKSDERGGRCTDWTELLTDKGVGFQSRYGQQPTDFFADQPFARLDDSTDLQFYHQPRLTAHLDQQAMQLLEENYGQLLHPDMQVLDLMSSWKSHLPTHLNLEKVTGLGLNAEELAANPQLTDYCVHDLNTTPELPWATHTFDAVICTVSVEYLTQPFTVFKEVARILKPAGRFIVSFSTRWFPSKTINIWPEIHEFERVGLVLEYFLRTAQFTHLHTHSIRNFPRPDTDKYSHETSLSDPIFIVHGQKIQSPRIT